MRNEMEGILCAISLFLICYHGYAKQDSIASKLAGIVFTILAYMSYWLFTKTSGVMIRQKIKRNKVYRVCAVIMAIAVIAILLSGISSIGDRFASWKPTLLLEIVALTSFGISWLTKGEMILPDKPFASQ